MTSDGANDGRPRLGDVDNTSGEHLGAIADVGGANTWVHQVRESIVGILIPSQGIKFGRKPKNHKIFFFTQEGVNIVLRLAQY